MKRCTKCKEVKPLDEYPTVSYKWNGETKISYRKQCTICYHLLRALKNGQSEEQYFKNKKFKEERNQLYTIGKKRCTKCDEIKLWNDFGNDSSSRSWKGKKSYCKSCGKIMRDEYVKTPNGKKRKADWDSKYSKNNRKKINKRQKNRRKEDFLFKFKGDIRNFINKSLNRGGFNSNLKKEKILGCSYEEFLQHIQSQFQMGMSWDNRKEWHIDHKIPLGSVDTLEETIQLCHYTNLQPLWAIDNLRKSNAYTEEDKRAYLEGLIDGE
jgi:hypothetical protein